MTNLAGPLLSECPEAVLAVDLDGTLVRGDMLRDGVRHILRSSPLSLAGVGLALLGRGRSGVKRAVARAVPLTPAQLPYDPGVIALIESWRSAGRKVVLATAAEDSVARAIAAHLGLFDTVHATTPGHNLKGRAKAACLVDHFGPQGFVYVGDSVADLQIWKHAAGAIIAGDHPKVVDRVRALGIPMHRINGTGETRRG